MQDRNYQQAAIRLGTHGENYGSWMSNPVFYVVGGLFALAVVLAVLSFAVFHITALGVVFVIAAVILLALFLWCAWIRRQYAFGGGGMMERTHLVILSHLDFDGQGQLLEVGCGSGPLSIRACTVSTDCMLHPMELMKCREGVLRNPGSNRILRTFLFQKKSGIINRTKNFSTIVLHIFLILSWKRVSLWATAYPQIFLVEKM